jgi:hypothetical protein
VPEAFVIAEWSAAAGRGAERSRTGAGFAPELHDHLTRLGTSLVSVLTACSAQKAQ